MNLDKFKVIMCPTLNSTKGFTPEATVEAEYGDICIEGTKVTLAHHGSRSANPAPCNTKVEPLEGGTILVSHLDLDTIGGIMALTGDKIADPAFWLAAEFIDVNGPHHVHEFSQEVQDKLNAVWAWNAEQTRERLTEPTDVTTQVAENYKMLEAVLDEIHPQHDTMIQKGKEWEKSTTKEVESKLIGDYKHMRVFKTDGVFCSGAYYSPSKDKVIPATVVYNEKYNSITIAFEDGGKRISAKDIVQKLWGPEAGGREGIAGSPRGQNMTEYEFEKAQYAVQSMVKMRDVLDRAPTTIKSIQPEFLFENYIAQVFEKFTQYEFGSDGTTTFSLVVDENQLRQERQANGGIISPKAYNDAIIGMQVNITVPDMELYMSLEENNTTITYMFSPEEKMMFFNACEERDARFDEQEAPHPENYGFPAYYWDVDDYTPVADDPEANKKAFEAMTTLYQTPTINFLMNFNLNGDPKIMNDIKSGNYNYNANYATALAALKYRTEAMSFSSKHMGAVAYDTPDLYDDAKDAINKAIKDAGLDDFTKHLGQDEINKGINQLCHKAIMQAQENIYYDSDELMFNLTARMQRNIMNIPQEYNPNIDYASVLNEAYWNFMGASDVITYENGRDYSCDEDFTKINLENSAFTVYEALKDNDIMTIVLGPYSYDVFEERYEENKAELENEPMKEHIDIDDEEIGDD